MRITKDINIDMTKLSSGLSAALSLVHEIDGCTDESCIIDFSKTQYITPLFVVPLCVCINCNNVKPKFEGISSYIKNISLDSLGIDSEKMGSGFIPYLKRYEEKSYIPLIHFPTVRGKLNMMDTAIDTVESIITVQSKLSSNVLTGLWYMLGEITDNISEHSKAESGYIFAQCYSYRGFIDICIGDTGITLLGSYRAHGMENIETDMDAMQSANGGFSTKGLPTVENRGYGIRTTKKMIVSGLGGQYLMASGSAIYCNVPNAEGYFDMPYGVYIPGTIIAMRIPLHENSKFNFINFVE